MADLIHLNSKIFMIFSIIFIIFFIWIFVDDIKEYNKVHNESKNAGIEKFNENIDNCIKKSKLKRVCDDMKKGAIRGGLTGGLIGGPGGCVAGVFIFGMSSGITALI